MAKTPKEARIPKIRTAESYQHPESESPMRPDVGTQAQFRKKKPPVTYRYDSSLSPALEWDGQNLAREVGERQLSVIEEKLSVVRRQLSVEKPSTADLKVAAASLTQAEEATRALKAMSRPFLNWAGKAERLSFDVPTLPLFVHERLSTKAIIETLTGHKRDKQIDMFSLFGDPQHSIADQVLRAYEYQDKWVNRMILGDSLVVMNSLLHYEGLGGQVQMIYMDPPYGVKFGSNFQPFVRKRDVSHGDDEDMTREPEMVQAYRDTWELGLHSYLTYLRDRLLLARDLLAPSGSIFVQISDDNLHHVRELLDEIFGGENFLSVITVRKTTSEGRKYLGTTADFLLLYARDRERTKYHQLYIERSEEAEIHSHVNYVVPDTLRWEQSAAYYIDTHRDVDAFVKNAGLGFAIPYLHNGQMHDYMPDFIIRLKSDPAVHLILETKGFDPLEEVKREAAERWVAAVNADGIYGTWRYALAKKVSDVARLITSAVASSKRSGS
jgi:adenine-specific DNA-methyltransferase